MIIISLSLITNSSSSSTSLISAEHLIMSHQEIRTETKTLPSTNKPLLTFKLPAEFAISRAAIFTLGLVISYTFIENSVSSQLMDYLTSSLKNERKAAIITNLQDGLSCISVAIVSLISEVYTGPFTMIAFCSSMSIMGLMLFWISFIGPTNLEYDMIYVAIFLITLGSPGGTISEEFLDHQLNEKVKRDREKSKLSEHREGTDSSRKEDEQRQPIFFLNLFARLSGYAMAVIVPSIFIDQEPSIGIGALIMVGTYLFFYFGYALYSHEELPTESNIGKIYRICKAAIRKREFRYPTSINGYYWGNYKQNNEFYKVNRARVIRLLPRVPSLLGWLEKAAIIKERSASYDLSPQQQEEEKELCTVKEAREMKSLALLFCWGFTFFAFSLVLASGNTFFVAQAGYLRNITNTDLSFLFIFKSIISEILTILGWLFGTIFGRKRIVKRAKNWIINFGFKRTDATVLKISVGMVCALICCLLAWHVEVRRLYLIKTQRILERNISMSTMALIPQFVMLGLAEFLAADGLKELFGGYTSKTMGAFDDSFRQLAIGTGKLFMIPVILIFKGWVQQEPSNTRFDKYFMWLAILNIVFLLLFEFYYFRYAYKKEYPEDEEIILMDQTSQHAHQEEEANARDEILPNDEGPLVSKEDEETMMKQSLEHAHQAASKEANARKEILLKDGPMVSEGGSDGRNITRTLSSRRHRISKSKTWHLANKEEPTIIKGDSSLEKE